MFDQQFTAEEYRIAAKVGRDAGFDHTPDLWEAKAARLDSVEDYARKLGRVAAPAFSEKGRGEVIIRHLLDDGWTPPEGLI
ncbi:hypothetical protein [Mycolicibacterium houstonense]|uniref:hypothetical protein n=1 Tax=Mycolicibacterium houstonense TaxID=146021 RepID=UPI0008320D2A|nr:hypothetical protein [Mycolicibacterium houstonense]